jgi:hypothetical protein
VGKACEIYQFNVAIYSTLLIQSVLVFSILAGFYLYKALNFQQVLLQEWTNPVDAFDVIITESCGEGFIRKMTERGDYCIDDQ